MKRHLLLFLTIVTLLMPVKAWSTILFGDHFDGQEWNGQSQAVSAITTEHTGNWEVVRCSYQPSDSYSQISSAFRHGDSGGGYRFYMSIDGCDAPSIAQEACIFGYQNLSQPTLWWGYWMRISTTSWGAGNGTLKLTRFYPSNGDSIIPGFYQNPSSIRVFYRGQYRDEVYNLTDTDWHKFVWEFQRGTGGSGDGVLRVWVDGVRKYENTSVEWGGTGTDFEYNLFPTMQGNINASFNGGNVWVDWDDFIFATTQAEVLEFLGEEEGAKTYYIDSSRPDDSGDGLSSSTAWKTIEKYNDEFDLDTFNSGDTVVFNAGLTYRTTEYLKLHSGLSYGRYGTGDDPLIITSLDLGDNADWTEDPPASNLWKTTSTITQDVGNMIFNDEASAGTREGLKANLNAQGEFWYDSTNDLAWLYSVGNPGTFYTAIEVAIYMPAMYGTAGIADVTIEDLDFRYIGYNALEFSGSNGLTLRDLNFKYIGGCYGASARQGNAIQFWRGATNWVVERIRGDQIYDAGITSQGTDAAGGYTVSNGLVKNCIFTNLHYGIEHWHSDPDATVSGVHYLNNTFANLGSEWSYEQRLYANGATAPKQSAAFKVFSDTASTSDVNFKNNICYETKQSLIDIGNAADVGSFDVDYNNYYTAAGDLGEVGAVVYDYPGDLTPWKTATGYDDHSELGDPLLTGAYKIGAGSPCIGQGLTTSRVTQDYWETSRPQGTYFDIGAHEYTCSIDADCSDGLYCTGIETCVSGVCNTPGDPCAAGSQCNNCCDEINDDCYCGTSTACASDGNPCTDDFCNHAGSCVNTPDDTNTATDNGLWCDGDESCSGGVTVHSGNPCAAPCFTCNETSDQCDLTLDADEDGYYSDACASGTDCDDSDPDVSPGDPEGPPGNANCTDGKDNNCNGDTDGADDNCTPPPECAVNGDCDDGNPCTDNVCDSNACVFQANTDACDDGIFCNGPDFCTLGTCGNHLGNPCDPWYICNEAADDCSLTGTGWSVPSMSRSKRGRFLRDRR